MIEPSEFGRPDKNTLRVFEVAKNNPLVHAVFNHYRHNKISWEEALILMVEGLAKANKEQLDMMILHHQHCTSPNICSGSEPERK